MEIRLAGVIESSINNGDGIRKVIFAQGCKHNCKGCFNPETHDFDGGYLCDTDKLIQRINEDYMIDGITFSGGDPFEQAYAFAEIAKNINKNLTIWCYTGYTYEYLLEHKNEHEGWEELLNNINVLVDGKFEEDKKDRSLKYRGSSNQRIIKLR